MAINIAVRLMTYTTQDLIVILDQELRANWQGQRVLLSSANRIDNPVVAKAIDLEKVSKVFAYQDFRHQIHQYQLDHRVSGIVWRQCQFGEENVTIPELHNQLVPIPGDKEILVTAKSTILGFWEKVTREMDYYLACDRLLLSPTDFHQLANQTEWAELDTGRTEVYLNLCWGNPKESQYQWAQPASGCHRLVASKQEPTGIKI